MSPKKEEPGAEHIKLSDDTKFTSPVKFIIAMIVACCLLFGGWVSLQNSLDTMSKKLEKVDKLEQVVSQIRDTQMMEAIKNKYIEEDRWTYSMAVAYNQKLFDAMQKVGMKYHPESQISKEAIGWPDVSQIKQQAPKI